VILSQASLTEDCHVVGYMLHRILFTPGTRFDFFPYYLQLFAICYVKQCYNVQHFRLISVFTIKKKL